MDDLQVYFCDLCNTSIPAEDLESGRALRFKDQRIGACCIEGLKQELAPSAAAAPRRDGGSPLAAIILVAVIAAGVMWLESRFRQEADRQRTSVGNIATQVQANTERTQAIQETLGGVAVAQDTLLGSLRETGAGLARSLKEIDRVDSDRHGAVMAATRRVQEILAELQGGIPDPRADLAAILAELTEIQARLAALEAAPEGRGDSLPPDMGVPLLGGSEGAPLDSSGGGLGPELRHHVQRLADEDPGVRFDAVDALLASADPKVVPHVLGLTKDPDAFVRRLVVEGLAQFPTGEVIEALIVALADPEENVRYSAHNSLRTVTGARVDYDPSASSSDRAKGQRRWRDWWERNRSRFG